MKEAFDETLIPYMVDPGFGNVKIADFARNYANALSILRIYKQDWERKERIPSITGLRDHFLRRIKSGWKPSFVRPHAWKLRESLEKKLLTEYHFRDFITPRLFDSVPVAHRGEFFNQLMADQKARHFGLTLRGPAFEFPKPFQKGILADDPDGEDILHRGLRPNLDFGREPSAQQFAAEEFGTLFES
jgi:hypothetical protein